MRRSTTSARRGCWAGAFAGACLMLAITGQGAAQAQEAFDPLEPVNRAIFQFNQVADNYVLEPTARVYRAVTPEPVRRSVKNFLYNLATPVVFANDLLQGERERAGTSLGRFMINSTLGVFGLFDAASVFGYYPHWEDMGQTFAVYGVPAGPYLMLPLFGPSTVRDTVGLVGDFYLDPLNQCCLDFSERSIRTGSLIIAEREANIELIDDLKEGSLDLYATVRTIYLQRRAAEIRNGRAPVGEDAYEDIFKDEEILDDPDAE